MPTLGLIGHSQSVLQYNNPPVTQLDRVSGFYPECWEFESLRADHGDVAQLVRAGDSYSQGRWFESTLHYHNYTRVAQWIRATPYEGEGWGFEFLHGFQVLIPS